MSINSTTNQTIQENPGFYFENLVKSPELLLIPESIFHKTFPKLEECDCSLMKRTYRHLLETEFMDQIKTQCPDCNAHLSLLSLGSGNCFQELVLLAKCLEAGYKDIEITLADSLYKDKPEVLKQFQESIETILLSTHKDAKIKINTFSDVDEVFSAIKENKISKPDATLLIDLQEQCKSEQSMSIVNYLVNKKIFVNRNLLNLTSLVVFTTFKHMKEGMSNDISVCNFYPLYELLVHNLRKQLLANDCESSLTPHRRGFAISKLVNEKITYEYKTDL